MNPRYLAYARAHGLTPDAMALLDEARYPGGRMAGFQVWMSERWADWRLARGRGHDTILSDADHADFDAWLADRSASLGRALLDKNRHVDCDCIACRPWTT